VGLVVEVVVLEVLEGEGEERDLRGEVLVLWMVDLARRGMVMGLRGLVLELRLLLRGLRVCIRSQGVMRVIRLCLLFMYFLLVLS
jgi:hypothetical protein